MFGIALFFRLSTERSATMVTPRHEPQPRTPIELDDADLVLLAELQRDARQTNRALASAANLAPSTTLARIRELERSGVIDGYHARVNLSALDRGLQALIFVRLQPKSQDVIEKFFDHVWSLEETVSVDLISGVEDAVIRVAVRDADALQRLVINEVSGLEGVFDERTSLLFEHKRRKVLKPL